MSLSFTVSSFSNTCDIEGISKYKCSKRRVLLGELLQSHILQFDWLGNSKERIDLMVVIWEVHYHVGECRLFIVMSQR